MRYIRKDENGNHPNYTSWPLMHYKVMALWTIIGVPAWVMLYYSLDVLPIGLAETI